MVSPKLPDAPREQLDQPPPAGEEDAGTNATQDHPNPRAKPIPDGELPYHPGSPYTTGNY
jgi:hypothetical protein